MAEDWTVFLDEDEYKNIKLPLPSKPARVPGGPLIQTIKAMVGVAINGVVNQLFVDCVVSMNGWGIHAKKQVGDNRPSFNLVTPPTDIPPTAKKKGKKK